VLNNLVVVGTWQVYYDVICLYSLTFNCYLNIGTIFFLTLGCTGRCSHCAALVVLELDCPRLITLCLQDCGIETEMLEHAVLGCTLLETLDVRSCLKVHLFALFEL
jgi:hypothetical protein